METKNLKLIKTSDVCEMLSISRSTLHRMVKRGDLDIIKINKCARFRLKDVERIINCNGF